VTSNTITLPGNAFTEGDAVTYLAPAAQTFAPANVDTAADTIGLQNHGFVTGQHVAYRTAGTPIGGLINASDTGVPSEDILCEATVFPPPGEPNKLKSLPQPTAILFRTTWLYPPSQ
jgi:hypothetical protein